MKRNQDSKTGTSILHVRHLPFLRTSTQPAFQSSTGRGTSRAQTRYFCPYFCDIIDPRNNVQSNSTASEDFEHAAPRIKASNPENAIYCDCRKIASLKRVKKTDCPVLSCMNYNKRNTIKCTFKIDLRNNQALKRLNDQKGTSIYILYPDVAIAVIEMEEGGFLQFDNFSLADVEDKAKKRKTQDNLAFESTLI